MNLLTKKAVDWTDDDISSFIKKLRIKSKPILVAANKADLCKDLSIVEKIKDRKVIICSAETELLLKKASKAGFIDYTPGSEKFSIKSDTKISVQQQKAFDLVNTVFAKIKTTGIQNILNSVIFDVLQLIAVYPVEDEAKLCNKNGEVLPDVKLLPVNSTAKDLAGLIVFCLHKENVDV